jgi:hypothetical protein
MAKIGSLGDRCLKATRPQGAIFDLGRSRCARHPLLIVDISLLMGSPIPPILWVGGMLPIRLPSPSVPSGSEIT